LLLEKTETFAYRPDGLLERILYRDEFTGEIERAEWYSYQAVAPKAAAKFSAGAQASYDARTRRLLLRLAVVGRNFPFPRNTQ
jgi:hypothetical protein